MATGDGAGPAVIPPGAEQLRRFRPKLRYELIGCGLHGHELLGTDAAGLRPEDDLFAREFGGLRWYRCLRCDSWLALTPPAQPTAAYPPERREVTVPLRGRPLRDKYVLRLIAVDRIIHFLVLSALAAAIFLFASNKVALNADFTKILDDLQGGFGGPVNPATTASCTTCSDCSRSAPTTCTCWGSRSRPTPAWRASRRSGCGSPSGGRST